MGLTKGQQQCVDTLDRPLVVAAGAGSGKTFTLTKRIVGALQSGYLDDIGEVCAITFTKKAAAELKSRLKGELRACGLIEQALKVDEAWVSTIHGMCARILRAHAIELELDPAFTVAEGVQVEAYRDQAVDFVLTKSRAAESSRRIDALFAEYPARSFGGFGTSVEGMLAELVGAASSQADGVDAFVMPGVFANPQLAVESAVEVVEGVLAAAAEEKASAKRDEWMAATEAQVESARAALERGVSDPADALEAMLPFKLAKTFGGKGFKAHVDEARGILGAFVMEARLGAASPHLETLVELTREALGEFNRLKRVDGVLDNNDLLVLTARALEEHPAIAARYSDKFKLVMVDEFQDTDQMQVDMIKRLAGEGACRLCTVGDAQQSIYRFRGADVSVYRRHLESIRSNWNDSIIELSQNFRSNPDVLSFVDKVFERPEMFGGEFMSLKPGRDEGRIAAPFDTSRNRVTIQHTMRPWRGVSSDESCQEAARRIAREFASLAAAGHSAGEMVVLLGRMTNAGVYAQALRDEGLPCVISGGSVFAGTPEAAIVRNLVRAIASPRETQALFNVLASPIFCLTAGDLLEVGRFAGFWKAAREMSDETGFSPQLECALRVMGDAARRAGKVPTSTIVERVVADSGWLSRLERGGAEGLASAGNVYKAIRMVRAVEEGGACGPVSTMRAFEASLDGSKEAPGALSVSGGNSVRIMTIHASKGLEFPIVAVAEFKEDGMPKGRLLLATLSGKVYLSLDLGADAAGNSGNVDLDAVGEYVLGEIAGEDAFAQAVAEEAGALHRRLALCGYLAAGDAEEAKRLLYVAVTRAKEAVVISSTGKQTKANPLGVPNSALAGIFEALDPLGSIIGEGTSLVDFNGSLPAVVDCVLLEPSGELDEGECPPEETSREPFAIPVAEEHVDYPREPFKALHEGIFSYSSISDASHEGDTLVRLAERHAVAVDEGHDDGSRGRGGQGEGGSADDGDCGTVENGRIADEGERSNANAVRIRVADDDDFAGLDASGTADADKATDLGTAFHRLAQYAVQARGAQGELAMPPDERVEALSRTCKLGPAQRARLRRALDRWFGCALARDMGALPRLDAEVPFFIAVPRGDMPDAFLEGEIDLLGLDADMRHAHVVDYKTGGSCDESADDLRKKHVLQAACYAYAVMLQGAESVDAVFVRVERGRADNAAEPQCVRYHFEQTDLPQLEQAITHVYARATT